MRWPRPTAWLLTWRNIDEFVGQTGGRHFRSSTANGTTPAVVPRRLLSLDYVVDHLAEPWLATEAERVSALTAEGAPERRCRAAAVAGRQRRSVAVAGGRRGAPSGLRSGGGVAGLARDPGAGLYTGILIWGAIGSGKTSACMRPFARQLLSWQAGDSRKVSTVIQISPGVVIENSPPLVEYQQQLLRLWALVGRPFCGLSKSRWSRAARPRGRQRPQAAAPLTPRPPSV